MAPRARILLMIVILSLLSLAARMRASLYADDATLWGDAAAKSPGKARVRNNYGFGLKEQFRLPEARREFEEAIRIDPGFADAYNNLATVCSLMGNKTDAIRYFEKTLALNGGIRKRGTTWQCTITRRDRSTTLPGNSGSSSASGP